MEKEIGILCHISSLPSVYGVGDFGKEAYKFVDFLSNFVQSSHLTDYFALLFVNAVCSNVATY